MNNFYEEVRSRAFSAFRSLAKEYAPFDDAAMLVGSADTQVSFTRSKVVKTIDTEWIDRIEAAIPALDLIIRNPSVAIEDVDEILPVELSKHITEKSIKHLAQHTNFILDVKGDEITPLKILNVFHEETALTYENKFVNTLLSRLSAFVDKRLRALNSANGIEMDYRFDYTTEFEHVLKDDGGRNSARINLRIELTSPLGREMSESDLEVNERYITTLNRLKKINMALISYRSSAFAERLGKNYVRPPVIRTNAILKNKNLRQCLDLWEFIEGYDRVGYSFIGDAFYELPSSDFVSDMYSGIALQYLTFYSSLTGAEENNRLISEKHLFETVPEFDDEIMNEELEDYQVYDSEYKKTVPVSRLMNNRKKLSEDEKKIRQAILIALRADEIINEEVMRREAEERRLAREKRLAEEAEAKRLAEEAARLRAEEEARLLAEEEARLLAEEEARRAAAARHEVEIRYRRSFMSRYIQAEPYVQDYYTEIKNLLLSYRGVKSRVSWSKESFKCGRAHIAKMDVKGKSLYLYLAIDPALLEGSKYRFAVAKGDCPVLMKIKSDRKFKHATELIEMLMAELGLVKTETEHVDYHLPHEDTDALIARGLIKIILPKGEVLDEYAVAVKADLSGIEAQSRPEEAEPVAEAAEPVAEAAEPDEDNEEGEDTKDTSADGEGVDAAAHELEIRYRRSFMSRLIQAEPYVQDYYTQIKNLLLSYRGVKARESWSKENFKCGRSHIAKMDVKGKSLYLYLNIDPEALEDTNYKFTPAKGDCPVLIKIKSERKLQHATELISMLMADLELVRTEIEPVDYHLPYEDTDALIARGLIKLILPKGESLGESDVTVKADLTEVIAAREAEQAEPTEAVLADEPAELINETEQDEVEIDSDSDDSENVDEDPTDSDTDDAAEPSESSDASANSREILIRYRRSFMSRYIQAEPYVQDYYTEIKNLLLSYRGVKSRISWSKESFKRGRSHIAKMDVKGKSLYLYLAIDPLKLEGTKYNVTVAKGECPVRMKIRSDRKFKHAMELIAMLMAELEIPVTKTEPVDYHLPYEDTDALIARGLIKLILPKGEVLDENSITVKAGFLEIPTVQIRTVAEPEEAVTEPVVEPAEAEPTVEETVEPAEAESAVEETVEPAEAVTEPVVEPAEAEPAAEETVEPAEAEPTAEETVEPTEAESAAEVNEAEVEIFSEPVAEEPVCENEVIDESADALTEAEEYIEPVADEVLDELIEEEITVIGDEKLFEARVDDMIKLSIAGKTTVKYSDFGKGGPFISRTRKQAVLGFAFRGAEGAESACVIAPYTREEYLALPRKKKKGVQSTIKALLRYAATVRLLESLKTRDTENERIAERISLLENRLVKERRLLPTAKQWTDAVNRVTNEN